MKRRRLLVLQPDAYRTGAPLLLDSLLRANGAGAWEKEVWLGVDGDLALGNPGEVVRHRLRPRWAHDRRMWWRAALLFWWDPIMLPWELRKLRRASCTVDLVLANTVVNFPAIEALDERVPLVVYVHELELSVSRLLTPAQAAYLCRRASGFIASSQAAADDLRRWHGVEESKITVIHPWLREGAGGARGAGEVSAETDLKERRKKLRTRLGLPEEGTVVVGCGAIDWVKGPDLFIDAAAELVKDARYAQARFVWVGHSGHTDITQFLRGYARHRGVEDRLSFAGEVANPKDWFAAADVLALTSRAESFSMAALEAASVGTPVAFFPEARGPGEFLSKPLGWEASEASGVAMAAALKQAMAATELSQELFRASARLRERFSEAEQTGRVWSELEKHVTG